MTGKDLSKQTFGRLTVLAEAEAIRQPSGKRVRVWQCRCECGKECCVRQSNLHSGHTTSCGCFHHERQVSVPTTHGDYGSREYIIWRRIIQRCENRRNPTYPRYGGRGIKICKEWRHSFAAFLRDVGRRPSAKHSIERKNNNGDYEPGNVRWATVKEQARNKRTSRLLFHDGRTLTIAGWSEITGINPIRIRTRLERGWTIARALTAPLRITSQSH